MILVNQKNSKDTFSIVFLDYAGDTIRLHNIETNYEHEVSNSVFYRDYEFRKIIEG